MAPSLDTVEVECYSGCKVNERPVAFIYKGTRWEVAEILDRWYEGSRDSKAARLDYFKVKTRQGEEFILRYSRLFDGWGILIR